MKKKHILISIIIFLISFIFYGWTSSRSISFGDSGEFVYASYNLSILHPPGYPLYSILGKIFTLLPVGSIPFRVNLMSSFFGGLTLAFLYIVIIYITDSIPSSLLSVTCLMFSSTFWHYSHYAKGYVLNLFFLSLLIFCSLKYKENKKWLYFWGFLFGLSCTYHYQSTVILLPAFIYFFFITKKPSPKEITFTVLLFILPLSLYLFLPLRAIATPDEYHWGKPETMSGFLEIVTGKIYGWHSATEKTGLLNTINQIGMYLKFLVKEFNWLGIIMGLYGIISLFKINIRLFIFTLIIYLINVLAVSYMITTEINIFLEAILPGLYLPAHFIFSIWIGLALFKINEKFKKPFLACIFLIIPIISLYTNFSQGYEKNNFIAYDFGKNCLDTVEENSILITAGDNDTFPLWYLQKIENYRKDVKIITMGLIGEKNYEKYLRDTVQIPWDEELYTGLSAPNAITIFINKNPDKKIYLTFHAAARLPADTVLSPRGLLYEAIITDDKKDFALCSTLLEKTYELRGITDKRVYKDFLNSSMMGPYAKAFYDLGEFYIKKGKTEKALEWFKKIEEIDYGHREDIKEEFSSVLDFQKARIAVKEEKWEEAIKLLNNAEKLLKNNSLFYITRASAYRGMAKYAKAVEDLKIALEIAPKSPEIYLELGKVYYEANDIQEALFKFSIALQLQENIPEGHYWLGKTYEKYNLPEKAMEQYKKELELNPEHKESQEALQKFLN